MPFRVTDNSSAARLSAQVMKGRQRLAAAQERVSSGRRINRPSDDPAGAAAALRLRTSQADVETFRANAETVRGRLLVADNALDAYELSLERAQVLLTQAASDTTNASARRVIAVQIEGIYQHALGIANARSDGRFVFGGTGQEAPPFDPASGNPRAAAAPRAMVQFEPGSAPVPDGVVAEEVFAGAGGTVFATLKQVAEALRGTDDPQADRAAIGAALTRLGSFAEGARGARASLGVWMQSAGEAGERLVRDSLTLEESTQRVEGADLAKSVLELTGAETALEATLQSVAHMGRRTLLDLIG